MSTLPNPDQPDNAIINRTDFNPIDPSDPPGRWRKFFDGIRQYLGGKPLYLVEQAGAGKVRKLHADAGSVEADTEATILNAQGDFAVKMAGVRKADEETRGKAIENDKQELLNDLLAEQLRRAKDLSPKEMFEHLKNISDIITAQHGGYIEFQTHDEEESAGDEPSEQSPK